MKGLGVFLPNEEDENTLLRGFSRVTFAQVEETETHPPFIHYNSHFYSPNHVIFVPMIGKNCDNGGENRFLHMPSVR